MTNKINLVINLSHIGSVDIPSGSSEVTYRKKCFLGSKHHEAGDRESTGR